MNNIALRHLLAQQHCKLNVRTNKDHRPIDIAVAYQNLQAVFQILSHMEDIICLEGSIAFLNMAVGHRTDDFILWFCQDYWGDTALHIAARINSKYCNMLSNLLVLKNIDLNAQNREGDTPLHIAVKHEVTEAVVQLLSHWKCNPNTRNKEGCTPVHIAAGMNNIAALSRLLAHDRCDPNAQNREGDTPLHMAVRDELNEAVVQLLSCRKCNPNAQNRDGYTPLHIAAGMNTTAVFSQLLAQEQCNPNTQNREGDTPLQIACYSNFCIAIRLLLGRRCSTNIPNKKGETAQEVPINEDGDCLLHLACQWSDVGIVRYLITDQRCNPNIGNFCMNTPLHIAVRHNTNNVNVELMLSCEECNPNAYNGEGDTPLHIAVRENKTVALSPLLAHKQCHPNAQNMKGDTPLHIAVMDNQTASISKLLAHKHCNPNAQNRQGDTPLHNACHSNFSNVVRLLLERRCSTNVPNKKGEIAQQIPLNKEGDCLLLACQWGDVGIIRYLIIDQSCNPNVGNLSMNTPLHIAVKKHQIEPIVQLLSCEKCNPNIQNREGDTPLHIAVREDKMVALSQPYFHEQCDPNVRNQEEAGNSQLCELIIANDHCDVNVLNKAHLTPLLAAIKHKMPSVATALLQHKKCDLTLRDPDRNTALHLACMGGETQPEMVKVAKQLLTTVDPSPVNHAGQTPIELTTNYQLIQEISHFTLCKTKHSVQTYINIFIVGNPETGKSTLVEAIRYEANILWRIAPKFLRIVRNVPPHTAGIIPTTFRSKTFGNTVLYDLAGQIEYYTSHAAVIQTTVISTPPAFIVVVNMSESEERISETLRYWWSFINNHAARASAPPQVILVGSHADKVKARGGSAQGKMSQVSALVKRLPTSFYFAGQVALDCRDPASRKLQIFCSLVNKSCCELRRTADVDLHCHVLYAFLLEKFPGEVACTVSDISTIIQESDALLPQNPDGLMPLISTLSDKGLFLLVRDSGSIEDSWIILQKQALLGEVNGTIFAPKHFSQHKKDLSSSTGVVPLFKLRNEFPDRNPTMIATFLAHLEFCFKVDDHETLKLLEDNAVQNMPQGLSEEYYFFPALVSVENPLRVWEQDDVMISRCGWFYRCIRNDQFLTTQFLHVLILRLAFSFALQLHPGDLHEDSLALHRRCSVWKHGIGWLNRVPIETVVEVGLLNQSVIVMMRCPKGEEAKCAQLRSRIIQKVIQVKDELCKAVEMSESFIHPTDVKYPFFDNTEDLKYYSLTEIAKATTMGDANVLDNTGRNPFPMKDLLLLDPNSDTHTELQSELFREKHSLDMKLHYQDEQTSLEGEEKINTNDTMSSTHEYNSKLVSTNCSRSVCIYPLYAAAPQSSQILEARQENSSKSIFSCEEVASLAVTCMVFKPKPEMFYDVY